MASTRRDFLQQTAAAATAAALGPISTGEALAVRFQTLVGGRIAPVFGVRTIRPGGA